MKKKQPSQKLTISLAQMEFEFGQPDANLERVRAWAAKAAQRGSDLTLFPELWASGYDLEHSQDHAHVLGTGIFAHISALAKEHRMALGGSLLEKKEGNIYNTFYLYGPEGQTLATYRKIHLFRLLDEEQWLNAGGELVIFNAPWGKTGLAVCYDLRFPEIFRAYALHGAKLILLVAEWPEKRIHHWQKLLQVRAIENQYFVAAVNKVGHSQGAKLGGRSAVLDPMGAPVVEGGGEEILLTAEIDLRETEQIRRWMPVFDDRSPAAYERLITYGD